MKPKSLSVFFFVFVVFASSACKKKHVQPNSPPVAKRDTDIYISGFTSVDYKSATAVYWKNGVITELTDNKSYAQASAIAVVGTDVYVAGSIVSMGRGQRPAYWKNGILVELPVPPADTSGLAGTTCVAVKNNDVYVTGYTDYNDASSKAAYWKNGVLTYLADHQLGFQRANGIVLKNNDVYITGFITDQSTARSKAVMWKNDAVTILSGTIPDSQAKGISINGDDIYICGSVFDQFGFTYFERAAYWKNNVLHDFVIPDIEGYTSDFASVVAQGTDLYLTGSSQLPFYLQNEVSTMLPSGAKGGRPTNMAVLGNNVYISGNNNQASGISAVYWKNGVMTSLNNGSSGAYGIAIVPR